MEQKIQNVENVAEDCFNAPMPWTGVKLLIDGYDMKDGRHLDGFVELLKRRDGAGDIDRAYKTLYKIILLAGKDDVFKKRITNRYGDRTSIGVTPEEEGAYMQEQYTVPQFFEVNAAQAMLAIAELVLKQLNDNENPKIVPLKENIAADDALRQAIAYCEEARTILESIPKNQKDFFHINQSWLIQAQLAELITANKVSDKDLSDLMSPSNLKNERGEFSLEKIKKYWDALSLNIYLTDSNFMDPESENSRVNRENAIKGLKYISIATAVEKIKLFAQSKNDSPDDIRKAIIECDAARNDMKNIGKKNDYIYHSVVITQAGLIAKLARLSDDRKGLEQAKVVYENEIREAYSVMGVPFKDIIALGKFGKISLELELGELTPQDINDYLAKYFTNDKQNLKWLFAQGTYSFNAVEDLQMKLEVIASKTGAAAAAKNVRSYSNELETKLQSIRSAKGRNPRAKQEQAAQERVDYAAKIALDVKYNKTNDRAAALKYAKGQFQAALRDLGETEDAIKNNPGGRQSSDIVYISLWSSWATCLQQIAVLENKEKENIGQFRDVCEVFDQALKFCEDYEKKNNVNLEERKDLFKLSHAYALNEQGGYLASIGDLDGAMAKYKASLDKIDTKLATPEAQMARSQAMLSIANVQLTFGRYNEAIESVKAGRAAIPAPTSSVPMAPIDFNITRTEKAHNVSLYNVKELELKLMEVQIIAHLNRGEYTYKAKNGEKYYYEDYIVKLNKELAGAAKVKDNYNTGDKAPFILLLNTLLIKARLGYGDILALNGEDKKAQEQYGQVIVTYNNIRKTWEQPLTASKFLLKDQSGVLQALPEAQANVISAHTRIADYLRSLNTKEWEAGKINKSRIELEKKEYDQAGKVVSADPANDPLFIALSEYFKPVNGELTIQEKNRVFAGVYLARADAKSRLPEARDNNYKDVSAEIDKAETLCNEAINKGYQNDLAIRIVLADVSLARANILCQRKINDPASVELYRVKEAKAEIEKAISFLEGYNSKNANNLQVKMKLAQAYEAKGYALLNRVAAMQGLDEVKQCFVDAKDIYNYKADGENSSIPAQSRYLGLARAYKVFGIIEGAQGRGDEAEASYNTALSYLKNVSDNIEKRRLEYELNFELGGAISSLWPKEEMGDEGESPKTLIDRCQLAVPYFNKALEGLIAGPADSFSDILKDLSSLPEEKRLYGYKVLLRMEMVKTISNEDQEDLYKAAISNLEVLRSEAAQFTPEFMDIRTKTMLVREIDLNIGRLHLWNKDDDKAREIFANVIQYKNGRSLSDILKADPKADIVKEAAAILKALPDDNNLAAVIHLGESWMWSEDDRDNDLAESLLDLPASDEVLSSDKLSLKKYCPLYLKNEVEHTLATGGGGGLEIAAGGSGNGKITDYYSVVQGIKLVAGITAKIGVGAGYVKYPKRLTFIDQDNKLAHKVEDKDDAYSHLDLGISKYFNGKNFMALDFSQYWMPQDISIQEITGRGGFGVKLPNKLTVFGDGKISFLNMNDPKNYRGSIGRANEPDNPLDGEARIGLEYKGIKGLLGKKVPVELTLSLSDIYSHWDYNNVDHGMGYPPLSEQNALNPAIELRLFKSLKISADGRIPFMPDLIGKGQSPFPHYLDGWSAGSSAILSLKPVTITAGWSRFVTGDHFHMDNTFSLNVALKLPARLKHFENVTTKDVPAVHQRELPKEEVKPAAAPQPAGIQQAELPQKEAANAYVEHAVKAGKTLHDIVMNELKKIKAGRGDNSRVTKEEYNAYLAEFKKLNIGSDGMMDSYSGEQKNRVAGLAAKYNTAGDPLHWLFVGQKIKLPVPYNNVRIAEKAKTPVQTAGNDVPAQKKVPTPAAESRDEKIRTSKAADQLMALLDKQHFTTLF
jgi:hypothetical protein